MAERRIEHECTSWMLFPEVTGGKTLLHKNRDAKMNDIIICKGKNPRKHKWIGLGNPGNPCMGLNEKGLAIVMNSGELTLENEPAKEKRLKTPAILQLLLETTATAQEAAAQFEEIIRQRKYTHGKNGSIFFFLDTTGGCLSECTAHNVVTVPVAVRGMLIRANIWHNPGMARYSTNTIKRTLDSASREFQAAAGLNEALAKRGFIALEDVWRTARMRGNLESMGSVRGLCSATTNSASTLELDQEFPDVLSTAYVTLGPPGHTVFLPVPVCVQDIPEDIMDGSWSRAAIARLEDQGLEFDSALWLKPEAELQAVYQKALQDAREALRQGQREGAVARLQQAFAECCRRARQEVMPQ